MKLALKKLLQAHPSIQVSTLLSGSLSTPSAKQPFDSPEDFESIATVTAAGGEASLILSSIPSTYKHLQLRAIARDTSTSTGSTGYGLRLNADGGSNYTFHRLNGNGTSVTAAGSVSQSFLNVDQSSLGGSSTASVFAASIIDFHDYSSTTKNKTVRMFAGGDGNAAGGIYYLGLSSSVWLSTSAITSITIYAAQNAWAASSTFALYGLK